MHFSETASLIPPVLPPAIPHTHPHSPPILTILLTEPIAEEIGSLRLLMDTERAAPRFSFQLEKRSLGTVHLNAITRYVRLRATPV